MCDLDLARVDALLLIEAMALPVEAFLAEDSLPNLALVVRTDQVDDAWQAVCSTGRDNRSSGEEELGQARSPGQGQVVGKIFDREDQAREVWRCFAYGG